MTAGTALDIGKLVEDVDSDPHIADDLRARLLAALRGDANAPPRLLWTLNADGDLEGRVGAPVEATVVAVVSHRGGWELPAFADVDGARGNESREGYGYYYQDGVADLAAAEQAFWQLSKLRNKTGD